MSEYDKDRWLANLKWTEEGYTCDICGKVFKDEDSEAHYRGSSPACIEIAGKRPRNVRQLTDKGNIDS